MLILSLRQWRTLFYCNTHLHIADAWYPCKCIHHWTWYSSDDITRRAIGHILISHWWWSCIMNCRVYQGTQLSNTDHWQPNSGSNSKQIILQNPELSWTCLICKITVLLQHTSVASLTGLVPCQRKISATGCISRVQSMMLLKKL